MNILKSGRLVESTTYMQASRLFGFDQRWIDILSGIKNYRFFEIVQTTDSITFKPNQTIAYLNNINSLKNYLSSNELGLILNTQIEKTFSKKQVKNILTYLHLDWLLVLNTIKTTDVDIQTSSIVEYLQLETGDFKLKDKLLKALRTEGNRSNIYTINQNSTIVSNKESSLNQHTQRLTGRNMKLIRSNKLLNFIEVDRNFDNEKLTEFLYAARTICNKIHKHMQIPEDLKFNLKIRKIKRTHKKGMFIVNQNTIIVDPRYTNSFTHELGHWYHTHFLPEMKDKREAEAFAETFKSRLNTRFPTSISGYA